MKLREYQAYAEQSVFDYYSKGGTGNPILALPTGTGKSVVLASFIKRVLYAWPEQRIVMLTHVKELIEQNLKQLQTMWPTAPVGVYSAGLNRRDVGFPITFAGIASVAKRADEFGHIDIILIDECHLVSDKTTTMYFSFIQELLKINKHLKVIGLTATPYRLKNGLLTEGKIFTDICCDMTVSEAFAYLIDKNYMAPLITKKTLMELNTDNVPTYAGEFALKQLQEEVNKIALTKAAISEMLELGGDRKSWLIFTAGVKHSEDTAHLLNNAGVKAAALHSKVKAKDRGSIIEAFKNGEIRALTNNNILTTGFDHPAIDLIGVLRPTKSTSLWVQLLGRGTRPFAGDDIFPPKQNCLVFDFAGNTRRLGPIDDPLVPTKKGKGKNSVAPVKVCEKCYFYNHVSARFCVHCGHEFHIQLKLKNTADTAKVMRLKDPAEPPKKKRAVIELYDVDHVVFNKHSKPGKPPSLKVTYHCGLRRFHEWVCLEHKGYPLHRARRWWRAMSKTSPPNTIDEALALSDKIEPPKAIKVQVDLKYPEILLKMKERPPEGTPRRQFID